MFSMEGIRDKCLMESGFYERESLKVSLDEEMAEKIEGELSSTKA